MFLITEKLIHLFVATDLNYVLKMHKAKKKTKTGKIPKPIKVKKEKTEEDRTLHPMSHYIDDRLELVKQIFGSLKPKTITNLAPDFLKVLNAYYFANIF